MADDRKHNLWLAIVAALAAAIPLFTDNDFYLRVLFLIGATIYGGIELRYAGAAR